jgi:hypothetical protein
MMGSQKTVQSNGWKLPDNPSTGKGTSGGKENKSEKLPQLTTPDVSVHLKVSRSYQRVNWRLHPSREMLTCRQRVWENTKRQKNKRKEID